MSRTILIVDDSSSMRQLVENALRDAGFMVIASVNGKDALTKLGGIKLDLVIADLNRTEMDGIEFIRQFRGTPGNRFTPVVMLTTESQTPRQYDGEIAGASGWLVKPFSPDTLLETVKTTRRITGDSMLKTRIEQSGKTGSLVIEGELIIDHAEELRRFFAGCIGRQGFPGSEYRGCQQG